MEKSRQRLYWRLCYGGVIVLSVLTFTPLVIPSGNYRPMVMGIPYTLWIGILVTVAMVGFTYGATQLYPVRDPDTEPSSPTIDSTDS